MDEHLDLIKNQAVRVLTGFGNRLTGEARKAPKEMLLFGFDYL